MEIFNGQWANYRMLSNICSFIYLSFEDALTFDFGEGGSYVLQRRSIVREGLEDLYVLIY